MIALPLVFLLAQLSGCSNTKTVYVTVPVGWMAPMMGKLEALYNLPAGLLRSVALTESGGNQFAVSGAGAQGLFQFMPG